jgi:DNA-damage-inducible protein D
MAEEIRKQNNNRIALFEGEVIRRILVDDEWYFSAEDIVRVLTDSNDVKQYIKKLIKRDLELNFNWDTICTLLPMIAKDGNKRNINCSDTEGMLRII